MRPLRVLLRLPVLLLACALLVAPALAGCGSSPEEDATRVGNSGGGTELAVAQTQRVVKAQRVVAAFCRGRSSAGEVRRAARRVADVVREEGAEKVFWFGSSNLPRRPIGEVAQGMSSQLERCGDRRAAAVLAAALG